MEQTSLLLARVAILFLVPVQLGIVAWYLLYWDLFPKYSVRRLLAWSIFFLSMVSIPLLQILIYRAITSIRKIEDPYVAITISVEGALALALMFYLLLKRRCGKSKSAIIAVTTFLKIFIVVVLVLSTRWLRSNKPMCQSGLERSGVQTL